MVLPTYNNAGTLGPVIADVRKYCDDIIVANDGSTDGTAGVLEGFSEVTVLSWKTNRGKGYALRSAFEYALTHGFRYAVTIDSDGQHFAGDLPAFIRKAEEQPDTLIVGARNMDQDSVPGTSSFGNTFSRFWFQLETGLNIPDIQSGYRLYPLERISEKRFYSTKYEFELEVLVRSAWHGIPVTSIPVRVYYAPKAVRISHFRKVADSARISLMNTILVFMALFWERPFQFAKGLKNKSFRGFINEYVINSSESNLRLALSVAVGLFIGVSPLWGWQMMITFGISYALKLNKFVAVAASNISIPPMIPLILFSSYALGGIVLEGEAQRMHNLQGFSLEWVRDNLFQYVAGSLVLGLLLALSMGLLTYILLALFRKGGPGIDNPAG